MFKNWKLLFKNICGNTYGWKNALKCVKCCLKIENDCLKSLTKHLLKMWWVFGSAFALFFFALMNSNWYCSCTLLHCTENKVTVHTLFIYCPCTIHGTHNHFIQKKIKNGSHGTIYPFKNYFATIFSIFSRISCIQTDSNLLILRICQNIILPYKVFWCTKEYSYFSNCQKKKKKKRKEKERRNFSKSG